MLKLKQRNRLRVESISESHMESPSSFQVRFVPVGGNLSTRLSILCDRIIPHQRNVANAKKLET